jgi:hypothetical protein
MASSMALMADDSRREDVATIKIKFEDSIT